MSETEQLKEPLSPRTHMEIVMASKQLVDVLAAKDHASGVNPVRRGSEEGPGDATAGKSILEFSPHINQGWRGQFFRIPSDEAVLNLSITATAERNNPQPYIEIKAGFLGAATPPPEPGSMEVSRTPHRTVSIPLTETIPEVTEVPEAVPSMGEGIVEQESQLDETSAQALLVDLHDIAQMQQ